MKFQILFLLFFYVNHIACKLANGCKFNTCGECISSKDDCVWCAQNDLEVGVPRCLSRISAKTKTKWCNSDSIQLARPFVKNITNNSFNDTINGIRVQLRPQRMYIKAHPGVRTPLTISFQPAKDYPLDIYYLMDSSYTMEKSKDDLKNQASKIYKKLTTYTNNVRLGIGSFIEKPAFPYADLNKYETYTFKNILSLTENVTEFIIAIDNIKFGANFDDPEAGLDALMQAMICESELGWRQGARKIIVLCSDSTFHSAGDGKIIGAIKPNDMHCHLRNNMYDESISVTHDYPSVSQINYVARKEQFIIVFAVKKNVSDEYKALATQIIGAQHAILEDGDAAVEIIKTVYLEYAQSVMFDFTLPSFVELTLDPDCKNKTTSACKSTPEQRTVHTNATVEVKYCPTDGKLKHELEVKVVGLKDKLTIELEVMCKCDCEAVSSTDIGAVSSKCHNAGVIQCGICKCNPGSYGAKCHCNGTSTSSDDIKNCFKNVDDKMWCSGRGECRCGKCENCDDGYSGDFCEFSYNSCPSASQNETCSGNGICALGKCQCNPEWIGADCNCPLSTISCTVPYSGKICSGNGVCKCGQCECNKLPGSNETYSGLFCDACEDCAEKQCKEFEDYVNCNVMKEKKLCDKIYKTNNTVVMFLNKTEIYGPQWLMAKWCKIQLKNDSYIIFKFQYLDNKLKLGIQNEAELSDKANLYVVVGSSIGTALLIGIITLIVWKVLTDLYDKREYKKFLDEAESTGFQNVLYVPPTQQFPNPAFEKEMMDLY